MEHTLDTELIVIVAASALIWVACSSRLERLNITAALFFVAAGVLAANPPLSLVDLHADSSTLRSIAELTLAILLFVDAAGADVHRLRREASVPARLLLIGLPLTVAAGVALALVTLSDLDPWACAAVAAIVAPTDAALGAPIMADRRLPVRIRQALNIESGLNDGLVTPIVTFCIAAAVAEVGDSPDLSPATALADLGVGVLVGVALGLAGGLVLGAARRASWMVPEAEGLAVLGLALASYAAAVQLGANGFVAAFVGGLAFGARPGEAAERLRFASETGEALALAVWFVFGALALGVLDDGGWGVAVFALLALTVARLVPVAVALAGTGMRRSTVLFIGWFGPRGLASVVFALIAYDELVDDPQRATVLAAVTATVLASVVAHGLTARPLAGRYAAALAPAVPAVPVAAAPAAAAAPVAAASAAPEHEPAAEPRLRATHGRRPVVEPQP